MLEVLSRLNIGLSNCIDMLLQDLKYQRSRELRQNKEVVRILNEIEKVDSLNILNDREKMESVIQICTYYKDFYEDKINELDESTKHI